MITKITTLSMLQGQIGIFYFSKLAQQGHSLVAQLPTVELPVRSKVQNQDRFSKQKFYDFNNYTKHDRPPRCRYYALEYKNRIYHVFNAYYYPMGRMIGRIATAIRGKNSPLYRKSHADVNNGDICVIVNAVDPLFTGKKLLVKNLQYHTGFIGRLLTYSYRHVLNKKPELLYYYLLRKFMPKNKLSAKYLENLKIYRGPTHDIAYLPQFAPDQNIYEYLPQANLFEYIRQSSDFEIAEQSSPGLAKQILGKQYKYAKTQQQIDRQHQQALNRAQDTTKLHNREPEYKQGLAYRAKQIQKMKRKQKRYLDRYKPVRAPYKQKNTQDKGFLYIKDERKARNMPEYRILADQDLPEQDEEHVQDPFGRKAKEAAQAAAKKANKDSKK